MASSSIGFCEDITPPHSPECLSEEMWMAEEEMSCFMETMELPCKPAPKRKLAEKRVSIAPVLHVLVTAVVSNKLERTSLLAIIRNVTKEVYLLPRPIPQMWDTCMEMLIPICRPIGPLGMDSVTFTKSLKGLLNNVSPATCGTKRDVDVLEDYVRKGIVAYLDSINITVSYSNTPTNRVQTSPTPTPLVAHTLEESNKIPSDVQNISDWSSDEELPTAAAVISPIINVFQHWRKDGISFSRSEVSNGTHFVHLRVMSYPEARKHGRSTRYLATSKYMEFVINRNTQPHLYKELKHLEKMCEEIVLSGRNVKKNIAVRRPTIPRRR